ncbi:hypothetical protein ISCGN_029710 [Ixodes scapularis]
MGEFPWMVGLRLREFGKNFCGGSLIKADFVLTAAHCLTRVKLAQVRVDAGIIDMWTGGGPYHQVRFPVRFIIHREYENKTENNDIALIKLDRPFNISGSRRMIGTICLTRKPVDYTKTIEVAGWGLLREAAHCLTRVKLAQVRVDAGIIDMWTGGGPYHQVRFPVRFIIHREYENKTENNDIALIKLDTPFNISGSRRMIGTICLTRKPVDYTKTIEVAGWGLLREDPTRCPDRPAESSPTSPRMRTADLDGNHVGRSVNFRRDLSTPAEQVRRGLGRSVERALPEIYERKMTNSSQICERNMRAPNGALLERSRSASGIHH